VAKKHKPETRVYVRTLGPLNPGSRIAKMNGFLRDPGLLKSGLESVRPSRCGIKEGIGCGAGVPVPSPLGSLMCLGSVCAPAKYMYIIQRLHRPTVNFGAF